MAHCQNIIFIQVYEHYLTRKTTKLPSVSIQFYPLALCFARPPSLQAEGLGVSRYGVLVKCITLSNIQIIKFNRIAPKKLFLLMK
jgi:hypothetical protein